MDSNFEFDLVRNYRRPATMNKNNSDKLKQNTLFCLWVRFGSICDEVSKNRCRWRFKRVLYIFNKLLSAAAHCRSVSKVAIYLTSAYTRALSLTYRNNSTKSTAGQSCLMSSPSTLCLRFGYCGHSFFFFFLFWPPRNSVREPTAPATISCDVA